MRFPLLFLSFLIFSCKTEKDTDVLRSQKPEQQVKTYQAELVFKYKAKLGEGALWNAATQQFYWVDIEGREFHTYDPAKKVDIIYPMPSRVGTVVSIDENEAMVALEDGVYTVNLESKEVQLFSSVHDTEVPSRFNDGKVDPNGNLWVGSMPFSQDTATGKLYRFKPDGDSEIMHRNIGISNGIVWTKDHSTMYFIDTKKGNIRAFDYDVNDSSISNERVAVVVPEELGFPDGMTIDENDQLWVGLWNGGIVAHYDPKSGKLLSKVEVPAHNVTACAFGGENFDQLYITTASVDMTNEEKEKYPLAGSVFVVTPGVKGVKAVDFGTTNQSVFKY